MPKCTINGREVEVAPGKTIIEAFKKLEDDIAHYCWHPGLSVAGVCRLCMVEIEGNPKLQIACNTVVTEGMKISNRSKMVEESVRWGMDFHLINHPLDCPICDQAGECGLQEQYMRYGQYDPSMSVPKVKKRKVVDLGERVVLDTERCILCSRCVRFTSEVSKTNELGIFNRGDHSEIGTFENKPLNNNYSMNTIDICPVGALTSRDFRFKQRVWYLKTADSICTGCSTGCNIRVHYNKEGLFRVKPRENHQVNGYWMCDQGRDVYKFANREFRLLYGLESDADSHHRLEGGEAARRAGELIGQGNKENTYLVVTPQYTNEDYDALFGYWAQNFSKSNVVVWMNDRDKLDQFDGLLLRGDRNANFLGLTKAMQKWGLTDGSVKFESALDRSEVSSVLVFGPENQRWYPDLEKKAARWLKSPLVVWYGVGPITGVERAFSYKGPLGTEALALLKESPTAAELGTSLPGQGVNRGDRTDQRFLQMIDPESDLKRTALQGRLVQVPAKSFIEKDGTYTNYAGLEQKVKAGVNLVSEALSVHEFMGFIVSPESVVMEMESKATELEVELLRKKNELSYQRGVL